MKRFTKYLFLLSLLVIAPNMTFANDNLQLILNNKMLELNWNKKPFISAEGYTLIPFQSVSQMLGISVIEDLPIVLAQGKNIKNNTDILLKADIFTGNITINNKPITIDGNVVLNNGAIYVPLNLFSEAFGYDVSYLNGIIHINNTKTISESIVVENATEIAVNEVFALVNQYRAEAGAPALTLSPKLMEIAQLKSDDMQQENYYSYTSPIYGDPFHMLNSYGLVYSAAGINLAKGQATPVDVVNAWMNSEGHKANILSTNYTQIGIGYNDEGKYWTQIFLKPQL
ncbi:hypothetical protein AN641_05715 [Candidatus Epulonipiscioides gigas]|nr:hypothetical protein AN641_07835 [Epulopiscium sp. SCG-C07WGA-EpuloA2]ONI44851.1 hypothetical protein AN641_05715 [Epulopiscium sp. SCG-C07WGA-EpuloA2]